MSQLDEVADKLAPLMELVQKAEQDLASNRDELERLVVEAQEALGVGPASRAPGSSRPAASAELLEFWAVVSAQLDTDVERLATHQQDVLALVDAALERTREESDAGEAHDAQAQPGAWGRPWEPPVLSAAPIEGESDVQTPAPAGRQRLARLLVLLGSALIVVGLLLLVV